MRCEIDIENERRELNSRAAELGVNLEDEVEDGEALLSTPKTRSVPNDAEEIFRKIDISLSTYYPHLFRRN